MAKKRRKRSEALLVPEFEQLHAHIRQREGAMVNVLTVVVVASLSLLAAIIGFLSDHPDPERLFPSVFLLLVPLLLVIPALAIITASRRDIYRMGAYIKIFLERPTAGFGWHNFLDRFRREYKEESLDHVPIVLWMVSVLSIGSYWLVLADRPTATSMDVALWLVPVPFIVVLMLQHRSFASAKDTSALEIAWQKALSSANEEDR